MMSIDYQPVLADDRLRRDIEAIVRLAIAEDLSKSVDWTTVCLVDRSAMASCQIRSRAEGVAAGLLAIPWVISAFTANLRCEIHVEDGDRFAAGDALVTLSGSGRDMLTAERTILNLVSRMCGIATAASRYVAAVDGTAAKIYDTRKTTPGYRRIEKYAVRCGGANNHRTGLHDGILIKDNHIAMSGASDRQPLTLVDAVAKAIRWRGRSASQLDVEVPPGSEPADAPEIVEVEVDTLEQYRQILPLSPNIILLDNFSLSDLAVAVAIRNDAGSAVQLESSGNVRLETVAEIAATGVDRISSGALTHQAVSLDLGLDWIA